MLKYNFTQLILLTKNKKQNEKDFICNFCSSSSCNDKLREQGYGHHEYWCFTIEQYTVKNAGKVMDDCVIYAWDTEANVVKVLQELHKLCKLNNCTPILSYEATADADKESCECKNEF